jgi:hypothetical protein
MTAVVSAIFGDYDEPKRHVEQTVPCEFVMVTDGDDERPPRMAAKEPKLRPWDFTEDAGPWIWIDGSFEIKSPTFVAAVLCASEGHPISQWAHPHRNCIYAEALQSAPRDKYVGTPIREQASHYHATGHPIQWGLWAAGLIVYREPLDYLADLWWAELNRWGVQDQISQPVALRRAGLRPHELPFGLSNNPWLRHHPHRDGSL